MGLMDKAKKFASDHGDDVAKGVDKATDVADEKTGGEHTDRLRQVDDAAAKYAGASDGGDDTDESSDA